MSRANSSSIRPKCDGGISSSLRKCPTMSEWYSATDGRSSTTVAIIRHVRMSPCRPSTMTHSANARPKPGGKVAILASELAMRWKAPGSVPMRTPQGQSHKTTLAQIAADQFGVPIDAIRVETGDTSKISQGIGTFAARTAVNAGSSVHLASVKVAAKAKAIAAKLLDVREEDLELRDGYVQLAAIPGSSGAASDNARQVRKRLAELAVVAAGMPGFAMQDGAEPGLESTAY